MINAVLIPYRTSKVKHTYNASLGILRAGQAQERFPFGIKQILLAHHGIRFDFAAGKNTG